MSFEYRVRLEDYLLSKTNISSSERQQFQNNQAGIKEMLEIWNNNKKNKLYCSSDNHIGEKYIIKELNNILNSPDFFMNKSYDEHVKNFYDKTKDLLKLIQDYNFKDEDNFNRLLAIFKNLFILIENIYISSKIITLESFKFDFKMIEKGILKIYRKQNIGIYRRIKDGRLIYSVSGNGFIYKELSYIYCYGNSMF